MKINFISIIINIFLIYSNCNCTLININGVEVNYTYNEKETSFIVKYPLKSFVGSNSYWGAIGLNSVPQMNDASVVVCFHKPEKNSVEHYYNSNYGSNVLDQSNPVVGIKNAKIVIEKDFMVCSFTRENTNANTKYFKLNGKAHIIVAFNKGNSMSYHDNNKGSTKKPITVSRSTIIQKTEFTPRFLSTAEQEISRGSFNLTWAYSENMTRFTLDTSFVEENITNGEVWSALVFNYENLYGVGDINLCKYSNQSTMVEHHYFNQDNAEIFYEPDTNGYSNSSISFENGILKCSFNRLNVVPDHSNYFNLTHPNKFILKFGKGVVIDDIIDFNIPIENQSTHDAVSFLSSTSS